MFTLPQPLQAMARYRNFIPYKLVPSATRAGKTDKLPVDYRTGQVTVKGQGGAHDPAIWLSVEEAALHAEALGPDYGVGFVFTAQDPFWFLDIDSCLVDGDWSQTAKDIMSWFPGCAIEVSASGKGLHLFGAHSGLPPHKTRYHQYFEFYTDNRFCALTGTNAIGEIWQDYTPQATAFVAAYLTPDATTLPTAWTSGPCEGWRGSTDDEELIKRMVASNSAASAFGGKCPVADLWQGNVDVLAKFYPPDGVGKSYNASSADMALAQALSFWTGRDCERMESLMRRSGLVRDKYEREDYLPRTIEAANARQFDVCKDREIEPVSVAQAAPGTIRPEAVTGKTFLNFDAQLKFFAGCVYITLKHRILIPGGYLLKPDQFRAQFGGYTFAMDEANELVSKDPYDVFINSQIFRAPRADGTTFRPQLPPGEIINKNGATYANLWWPIETEQADGDVTPFTNHLAKLLPDEDDRAKLLAYMAAVVQYPGIKFQWAPIVQGVEGNGKTFLTEAIRQSVGERYSHYPNTQDLSNRFTGWLEGKLFIALEELKTNDRQELVETLKPLITNASIEIQSKGVDQVTGENCANFYACTNFKDALPKTNNDRRWGIFFCAQQEREDLARDGLDGTYMPTLWDWAKTANGFAIMNKYLRNYKIPVALNPAGAMHRAPDTSATREAIALTAGAVEQEIQEAIDQGLPGFAGGWVSTMALDALLTKRSHRHLSPRKRGEILRQMGFVPHPHLEGGRVNNSVKPDGGKTRLMIPKGHINGSITDPKMIAQRYTAAQDAANMERANFGVDGSVNKA